MLYIFSFTNRDIPDPVERKPLPGLLEDITLGKKVDVTDMPACHKLDISRIPSPLPFQRESKKENIDLDYVSFVYVENMRHYLHIILYYLCGKI